jgi:hypothetical protein
VRACARGARDHLEDSTIELPRRKLSTASRSKPDAAMASRPLAPRRRGRRGRVNRERGEAPRRLGRRTRAPPPPSRAGCQGSVGARLCWCTWQPGAIGGKSGPTPADMRAGMKWKVVHAHHPTATPASDARAHREGGLRPLEPRPTPSASTPIPRSKRCPQPSPSDPPPPPAAAAATAINPKLAGGRHPDFIRNAQIESLASSWANIFSPPLFVSVRPLCALLSFFLFLFLSFIAFWLPTAAPTAAEGCHGPGDVFITDHYVVFICLLRAAFGLFATADAYFRRTDLGRRVVPRLTCRGSR